MFSNSLIAGLLPTDFGLGTVNKYVSMYHTRNEMAQMAHFLGQFMVLFSFLGISMSTFGIVFYF